MHANPHLLDLRISLPILPETGRSCVQLETTMLTASTKSRVIVEARDQYSATLTDLRECFAASRLRGMALFEMYYDRFAKAFPSLNSRSTLEECLRDLHDPRFHIEIAIREDQVVGGLHWWEFDCRLGLEEHIWSDPSVRGHGVGEALDRYLCDTMLNRGMVAMISELQDPYRSRADSLLGETDSSHTATHREALARLGFFERLGRGWIDAPYCQPALRLDATYVDDMILTIQPLSSRFAGISQSCYLRLLRSYFEAIAPEADIQGYVKRHADQISGYEVIPIRTLQELRIHRTGIQ